MVDASIDNASVSIVLANGEQTTVPTGETWRVTLTVAPATRLKMKGAVVFDGGGERITITTVLTGGDVINNATATSNVSAAVHIGGFKV